MSLIAVNNSLLDVRAPRIDQTIGRPLDQRSRTGGPAPAGSGSTAAAGTASTGEGFRILHRSRPKERIPRCGASSPSEERAYFANSVTSGPLTYSKVMMPNRRRSSALPAARGGRVDVRA